MAGSHIQPPSQARAAEPSDTDRNRANEIEFFESKIRPILIARCLDCHGAAKQKGGLRLDSRASILSGGSTGPAVEPGKPEVSLLVDAINYGELYQMPPKSQLPAEEIGFLTEWVRRGLPWGVETGANPVSEAGNADSSVKTHPTDDHAWIQTRAQHWSFQPVHRTEPPEPARDRASWPLTPIDRFLLASLVKQNLQPAPEASKRVLIRRLSFDLIGLPPTIEEIDAFLADDAPDAYERLVDRLLASPRYGERWARHWLDLVRYADTAGHEFDYDLPNAFGYRDYVVRALNSDLPYDQFVVEQVAGDLLESPRRHPTGRFNESILGTGFFGLGEGTHSPVDVRDEQMRRIDNQIDVLGKSFLGLTISCARCHDHKFDPISAEDYYALAGYLRSSRHQQAFIDPPDRFSRPIAELTRLKRTIRELLVSASPELSEDQRRALEPLFAARQSSETEDPERGTRWPITTAASSPFVVFDRFTRGDFGSWFRSGFAFGDGPSGPGEFRLEWDPKSPNRADRGVRLRFVGAGQAHSGLISDRLQGVLRSRSFIIEQPHLHVLASGRGGRINLVVDGFEKIRAPIYGGLTLGVDSPESARWYSMDLSMWVGHSAYLEIADGAAVDFTQAQSRLLDGNGFVALDSVIFSASPSSPPLPSPAPSISFDEITAELDASHSPLANRLRSLLSDYHCIEQEIGLPALGLAQADGTGEDERILIRGNTRNPGSVAARRFLEVLGGQDQSPPASGSGRLDLAQRITDPSNPLVARVLVNRIWKHHFGEGLVRSTDDFGAMGRPPSHPELLDWLASEFIARNWSIKELHRLLVCSRAYRMESRLQPDQDERDPGNVLLHRMNVRRLEAEAIRDTLLHVSGSLNPVMYGPPVAPHLTPFLQGRGRPQKSGPLDGEGRRSLYLAVRRNFLNPLFQTFDAPVPFSTMGRRNVSNVPAQALALWNDPFVEQQARLWAERLRAEPDVSSESRIERLFLQAFGRPPAPSELARCLAFLSSDTAESSQTAGVLQDGPTWAELCHVLINAKEFLYIE
jgi:hypothetical protein